MSTKLNWTTKVWKNPFAS